MTESDDGIPEYLASRIEDPDYNKDLTQYNVALEMATGDRPYYNVTKMHAVLGSDISRDTVRARFEELEEREVLEREGINNGDVFWLDRRESDWPIPNDVDVEPERTELTVTEWRHQSHIQVAAFAIVLAILGTAITLVGTFEAGGYYDLPMGTSDILAVGLSMGIVSYIGLFMAGLLWVLDLPDIHVEDLRG